MIGGLSALFVGLAAVFGVMLGGTCGLVGSALVGLLDANLLILTFAGAGLGATLAVVLGSTALVGGASGGALGLLGSALHRIESVEGSLLPQLFLTAVGAIVGALLGYHVLHGATAGLCASVVLGLVKQGRSSGSRPYVGMLLGAPGTHAAAATASLQRAQAHDAFHGPTTAFHAAGMVPGVLFFSSSGMFSLLARMLEGTGGTTAGGGALPGGHDGALVPLVCAAVGPSSPQNASWHLQRALLTPQVNHGSLYRRGKSI